jgi:hypothetical protein
VKKSVMVYAHGRCLVIFRAFSVGDTQSMASQLLAII